MPVSLTISRAPESARVLNPSTMAFEAAASCTSEAVMPPTPLATTLTCTSSVESLLSASRKASALPCTSALMSTPMTPALASVICKNTSPTAAACLASFTSRNLP